METVKNEFVHYNSVKSVHHAIDQVLVNGAQNLYDKYLWTRCPAYYARDIIEYNDGVINQLYTPVDKGETKLSLQYKWREEKEPVASNLDHNARSSIKVEHKALNSNDQYFDDTQSLQSSQLSTKFFGNIKSQTLGFSSLLRQEEKPKNNFLANALRQPSQHQTTQPDADAKQEPQHEFVLLEEFNVQPETPDSDIDRLRERREIKDKDAAFKNQNIQKKLRMEAEFEKKKENIQKNIKHKKITSDYNGDIIYIKPVNTRFGESQKDSPFDLPGLDFKNPNRKPGDVVRLISDVIATGKSGRRGECKILG